MLEVAKEICKMNGLKVVKEGRELAV